MTSCDQAKKIVTIPVCTRVSWPRSALPLERCSTRARSRSQCRPSGYAAGSRGRSEVRMPNLYTGKKGRHDTEMWIIEPIYRMYYLRIDLGWAEFDLDILVQSCCLGAQRLRRLL